MIEAKGIHKTFQEGEKRLEVLRGVDLTVGSHRKIGIVGASGTGKSTLLHILGGLDAPSCGKVLLPEGDLYQMNDKQRARIRNRYFGFVFQFYHLLPELTVLENVFLPAWMAGLSKKEALDLGRNALGRVGLADRAHFPPGRLSGGEQQRSALARALCARPKVILADEPTGNLDETSGGQVIDYLLEVVAETEGALVLVTHNRDLTRQMDDVFELHHGILHKI